MPDLDPMSVRDIRELVQRRDEWLRKDALVSITNDQYSASHTVSLVVFLRVVQGSRELRMLFGRYRLSPPEETYCLIVLNSMSASSNRPSSGLFRAINPSTAGVADYGALGAAYGRIWIRRFCLRICCISCCLHLCAGIGLTKFSSLSTLVLKSWRGLWCTSFYHL